MLIQLARKLEYTIFTITIANIKKALTPKKHTNPAAKVLLEHHKHLIAFLQKKTDKLLEHQLYNHKIVIKKGKYPRFKPLYKIS